MNPPVVLALEGIAKRFGATDALVDASLAIRPGTIHALLGENGAGKTTLMRVAYGLVQPDRGTIRDSQRRAIRLPSAAAAIRARIGMVHQHFTIVHAMTVAENVALGGRGVFDRRAAGRVVRDIAATIGVTIDPEAIAGTLGVPAQQQLEIIKALSRDAAVLILDEPTAVLAPVDAERLLLQLRALADSGLSVVLITHKLREALAVADDVTVLRRGTTVLAADASSTSERALAAAMVGDGSGGTRAPVIRSRPAATVPVEPPRAVAVAHARGVSVNDDRGVVRVRDVNLEILPGEIVGIAGVEGSGVRELLRALAGRASVAAGSLETPRSPGFIPEDRHHDAVVLDFTLTENIALRGAGARRGMTPWRALRDRTRTMLDTFDIRASGTESTVRALSGGNQQKLVLARELDGSPELLVAENPTRGLDLRATAAVHERLRAARDAGMAIVMYSSDLDELLQLADRIFVMFAGALIRVAPDRHAIGQGMLGSGERFSPSVPESAHGLVQP